MRSDKHSSMHGPRPKGKVKDGMDIHHEFHAIREIQHPHLKDHMAWGAAKEGKEHDESKETY